MLPKTEKSIESLLNRSFSDMVGLLDIEDTLDVRIVKPEEVLDQHFQSVMFTLASSVFRIVLLVHFQNNEEKLDDVYRYLKFENTPETNQKYHDYVCELGNNFCGVACRIIGGTGFSTGMSTPIVLENLNSTYYLKSQGPNVDCHIGSFNGKEPIFFASLCLFVDESIEGDLELDIPHVCTKTDDSIGELEFF